VVDVATGPGWELRLGDYREVLADVTCDLLCADPPYSARTHEGQRHGRQDPRYAADACLTSNGLPYAHWAPEDVAAFVTSWHPRVSGWFACMTSHDLAPAYEAAYEAVGRYVFAPLSCVQTGRNVRLAGDGPAQWTDKLCVGRPRDALWLTERKRRRDAAGLHCALPGAYIVGQAQESKTGEGITGGKPLDLMRASVRDYSEPGDVVCDPTAGGATTLLAAVMENRTAIGAERDPETWEKAVRRLRRGYTAVFDFGGAR